MTASLTRRLLLPALLCLGLLLPVLAPAPSLAFSQQDEPWPVAAQGLVPDPAVRFGRLGNGMRYAVMRNATPAGQAAVRLRIGAGSLDETDAQQGLAHFLEHMAFKGSKKVPQGEMVRILERKGLAFGPDTNAQTSYDQTVYMLDLPEVDGDTLDTGLMLMRETASELTLDSKAFDGERGVILSEERLRDTPQYRAQIAFIDILLDGQLATRRAPIGKVDIIRHAPVDEVRAFYKSHYRPDNAVLVVVGDIDPDAIEAKIKDRFADWKADGPPPAAPDLGGWRERGLTARVVEVPGAGTQVRLAFSRPYTFVADSVARQRALLVDYFGLAVLNRRLGTLARGANPPFMNASSGAQDMLDSAKVTVVVAETEPAKWQAALEAMVVEQRRLVQFGVTKAELDREITQFRASLESQANGAATRRSVALANQLVSNIDNRQVFTTPAADLALFDAIVRDLTVEEVNKAVAGVFTGAGPLLQLSSGTKLDGGDAVLAAAYGKAAATPVAAFDGKATATWPYTDFGTPGAVVDRREVADLGVVQVRFANNVRLSVKKTDFAKDQIMVSVLVGNGRLALPLDRPSASWAATAFVAGGLGRISQEDMDKTLAGVVGSVNFSIDDAAFRLSGTTRPADFLTQLQLFAAYIGDAGYRPEAFPRTKAAYVAYLPQLAATPEGVLGRDMPALVHSDDPRWRFPTLQDIDATPPDALEKLLRPALAAGPLDVTIVGDVGPDEAVAAVARTFGALPARDLAPPSPQSLLVRFPPAGEETIRRTHRGRADQAIAFAAWPATDMLADPRQSRVLYLTGDILRNRLLERIRIAEGATYSPSGDVDLSQVFPGYGIAYTYVETPPDKVPGFFANLEAIVRDMAGNGVSDDELARVKTPRIERVRKSLLTNELWLQYIAPSMREPRLLDYIRGSLAAYEAVTPAQIKAAAAEYLLSKQPLRVTVLPEAAGK